MANCWNAEERARIREKIAQKESLLSKLYDTYDLLSGEDVESYRFDSGEGSQQTKRRTLKEVYEQIETIENEIRRLYRRLECGSLVNLNLRRNPR